MSKVGAKYPTHLCVLKVHFMSNFTPQNQLVRWGLHPHIYALN